MTANEEGEDDDASNINIAGSSNTGAVDPCTDADAGADADTDFNANADISVKAEEPDAGDTDEAGASETDNIGAGEATTDANANAEESVEAGNAGSTDASGAGADEVSDAGNTGNTGEAGGVDNAGEVNSAGNADDADESEWPFESPIIEFDNPYEPLGPHVKSSSRKKELSAQQFAEFSCRTANIQGAFLASIGNNNRPSVVVYGRNHLSTWTPDNPGNITTLTGLLPKCNIKTLVPLSPGVLGIVADVDSEEGGHRRNTVLVFDINTAQDGVPQAMSPFIWPETSPRSGGVSKLCKMWTDDNRTYFLGSEVNTRTVNLHSFAHNDGTFEDITTEGFSSFNESPANALCYDSQFNRAVISSAYGQISVVDGITSNHIYDGWLDQSVDMYYRPKVTNISVFPTSPHLMMMTCSTIKGQIKVVDLRMPIKPVLSCGMDLTCKHSENLVPALDPYSGVIVAPYNADQTKDRSNQLAFIDTRFINIAKSKKSKKKQSAIIFSSQRTSTSTVSFASSEEFDRRLMLTAGQSGI
ncbi:hypothetical protein GGI15_002360, partial [Coemansia interrupta]